MSHDPNSKSGKSSGTGKDRSRSIIDSQVPAAPPAVKPDTATNADAGVSTQPKSVTGPSRVIRTLGRYSILSELGRGGMGAVYLAEDSVLQRKVALKIPQFEPSNAEQFQARFLREAQMAAQLSHPNICHVHDVGVIDGQYVMAMEYIEGRTLGAFTKPEKLLPERQAVLLVKKVALAVEAAHLLGMIHRDLKPGNVMLPKPTSTRKTIEPKVMDFGLAKSMDARTTELTKSGMIVGTPCYMSKEQWSGKDAQLGPPCDVYSLGIILYELLTGKLPYDVEEDEPATAWFVKLITEPQRRPSERKPGIDAALEAIVMKAIAKEPADRYASMAEFASALDTWAKSAVAKQKQPEGAASQFDFDATPESLLTRATMRIRRKGPPSRTVLLSGVGGFLLVLLGVILWFKSGDTLVKVDVLADGYEVTFKEAEITITDGKHETQVKPGEHTLHIKSGRPGDSDVVQEFDTEKFTLKKGDKPVVKVTLETGEVVAKLNDKPIGRRPLTILTTTIPADVQTFENHSYKYYDEELSWKEAQAKCVSLGGNLVVIDNAEESKFVAGIIAVSGGEESWIGITDEVQEGKWLTVTGQPLTFTNWSDLQPNNKDAQEHYGMMSNREFAGVRANWKWNDRKNHDLSLNQFGFVCQWNNSAKIGNSIDLLKQIDLKRDVVKGAAQFENQRLVVTQGTADRTQLQFPVSAPPEYSLTVEFQKTADVTGHSFNIGFPIGDRQTMVVVDAHGKYSGLETVDGKDVRENSTRSESTKERIVLGELSVIQIDVRKNRITAMLNRNSIVDWTGDFSRLGLIERWRVPNSRSVILGSSGFPFEIQSCVLTPIDMKKWRSLFSGTNMEAWEIGSGSLGLWSVEAGELVMRGTNVVNDRGWLVTKESFRDCRLRFDIKLTKGCNSGIGIRMATNETGPLEIQLADDTSPELGAQVIRTCGCLYGLANRTVAPPLKPMGEWNCVEVDVIGEQLTSRINGTVVFDAKLDDIAKLTLSRRDITRREGHLGLQAAVGEVRFRNIEIEDLSQLVDGNQFAHSGSKLVPKASAATPAPAIAPTRKVAAGQWLPLVDDQTPLPDPSKMKLTDGVLELDNTNYYCPNVVARNVIVRAKVRKLTANKHISLIVRRADGQQYEGFHWFNVGAQGLGIAKNGTGGWKDLPCFGGAVSLGNEFFDMEFEAKDSHLKLSINGKVLRELTNSDLNKPGDIGFGIFGGKAQFKDVEFMVLDELAVAGSSPVAPVNGTATLATDSVPSPVVPAPKAEIRLDATQREKLLIAGGRHSWALTADDKKIVTGTFNGDVELWDAETGAKLHTFPKHDEWVPAIACSPAEPHIVFFSGYAKGNIRRLNLETLTSEPIYTLGGAATSLSGSKDGKRVLVATGGGNLDIFDATSGEKIDHVAGARAPACYRPDDPNVVFFTRKDSTNSVTEWNLSERREVRRYKASAPGFSCVTVSADGQRIAVGCGNIPYANGSGPIDQIYVWSTANGDNLATLKYQNTKFGSSVAFSSDAKSVWASGATTVQFDIATGEQLTTSTQSGVVQCFHDGRRILIAGGNGIEMWRLREVPVASVEGDAKTSTNTISKPTPEKLAQ